MTHRHKSRMGVPRSHITPNLQKILVHHLVDVFSGCWVWNGHINNHGYGVVGFGSRATHRGTMLAHRMSYEVFIGPIPRDLNVLHSCDNPSCINPEHLFAGTHLDNHRDMVSKGRQVILRGEDVGTSKLTASQVREIKSRLGYRNSGALAREFGVSDSLIDNVRYGKSWRHVK
jgi:hypothetical protein